MLLSSEVHGIDPSIAGLEFEMFSHQSWTEVDPSIFLNIQISLETHNTSLDYLCSAFE